MLSALIGPVLSHFIFFILAMVRLAFKNPVIFWWTGQQWACPPVQVGTIATSAVTHS